MAEEVAVNIKEKKSNNTFKYILFFIIFFALGAFLGIYGTKKFLDSRSVDNQDEVVEKENGPLDITKDTEYEEIISNLYSYLNNDVNFYSAQGINMSSASNELKLKLVYNYIINNKLETSTTLNQLWVGSTNCDNGFVVDINADNTNGTVCTVAKFTTTLVDDTYRKLFGENTSVLNSNFKPTETKSCVLVGSEYFCGNVLNSTGITGNLESKFEIVKVLKNENSIEIYDKGYLVDTRSNVININDGYDNHYLHSSDSTEYYYELKSSDNLTFKHTFKLSDNGTYYYSDTKLSE